MALTGSVITQALMNARAAGGTPLDGPAFPSMATGIGNAVWSWAVGNAANLALRGAAVGTVGSGVINPATTKILVAPNITALANGLAGFSLQGPMALSLATVVAFGISQVFIQSAQYTSLVGGVGAGQDVSAITTANSATLTPLLAANLANSFGSTGMALSSLSTGLAVGIANMLLGSSGTGTVTGAAGPSPGTATTFSVVV